MIFILTCFEEIVYDFPGRYMQSKSLSLVFAISGLVLISLACAALQPAPAPVPTSTPEPMATITVTPTNTADPSPTPRPTQTPNLGATQRAEQLNVELQRYYEKGYLATTRGRFKQLDDFSDEWAQLGWYKPYPLRDSADDFFLSAHFQWDSAFKNANISGCGFMFGIQENGDHYAVFLDRKSVLFLMTDQTFGLSKPISPTRGTGHVNFDYPAGADFTLIVRDSYARVLVDGALTGEYTLSQSRPARGHLALTILSGTNKDYGTHCEMTDIRLWLAED